MEFKKRGQWGSTLGFLLAAIGSAVGLGNIWAFPYKMGSCGGFSFLIIYLILAALVGFPIMVSELALGRHTRLNAIGAYSSVKKGWGFVGFLAVFSPFVILGFYTVLAGYCAEYMALNLSDLAFDLQGSGIVLDGASSFDTMLKSPIGAVIFALFIILVSVLIDKNGISQGIEKFNKIGMPALFVMLVIIIVRAVTLPGADVGLKFMFVPGYAVENGFIEQAPNFITVLATAGGQMFFSLSLAMGIMVTYGSYLGKKDSIPNSSVNIIFADTLVAVLAGLAVIPAAVANAVRNGIPYNEIKLSGPNLLFVTLQDVFVGMGKFGSVFGVIFYLLVLIAAVSSIISLMEVINTYFVDRAAAKGKTPNRSHIVMTVGFAVMLLAVVVALDGLGSNGLWVPGKSLGVSGWNDCWLDFFDCISEGIAMPVGALMTSILVGWVIKPKWVIDECEESGHKFPCKKFFVFAIRFVVPIVMLLILFGQINEFFKLGLLN